MSEVAVGNAKKVQWLCVIQRFDTVKVGTVCAVFLLLCDAVTDADEFSAMGKVDVSHVKGSLRNTNLYTV